MNKETVIHLRGVDTSARVATSNTSHRPTTHKRITTTNTPKRACSASLMCVGVLGVLGVLMSNFLDGFMVRVVSVVHG
jgi:hypothetical protein